MIRFSDKITLRAVQTCPRGQVMGMYQALSPETITPSWVFVIVFIVIDILLWLE